MEEKARFPRHVYLILLFVLVFGLLVQLSRTQFVLQFQQNHDLLDRRDQIFSDIVNDQGREPSGRNYCVVYSSMDEYSVDLRGNAVQTLQYMKKKSTEINLDNEKINPDTCDVLIVATDTLEKIGDIKELERFVANGGYVLFMSSLSIEKNYQTLYRKLGVSEFGEQGNALGVHLKSNVLIGEKNLLINDEFISNTVLSVGLDDNAELLVESAENIPLLWKMQYEKGTFMSFNGTMLQEKINRGFFAGALSLLEPDFIYPIFNSKVFYIDDFPSPIPKGTNPILYEEYKKDTPAFYQDIWWPNMLKVAKKYNIKYTGAIIESYNDQTMPPFENPVDEDRHNLIAYGRELIKSGGELGLHGYNHQSLVMDPIVSKNFDYNAWENEADMMESIKEVLSYIKESFPEYKAMSYVPPSNVLSGEGRAALKEAWPELTAIASLYGEDETDMSYVQEYEVAADGIIEMPRVTSGYSERDYDRWAEANTMTGLGVYSHFVHPDDVISNDRSNNMTWGKIYKDFNENMSRVDKTYPWVRSMPATNAAIDMAVALSSGVEWTYLSDSIEGNITNFQSDVYYVFRSERKIGRLHNCHVKKIDSDTYLVVANGSNFKIELGGS